MLEPVFDKDPLYVWIGSDDLVHVAEPDAPAFLCGRQVGPDDRRSFHYGIVPGVACVGCYRPEA